MKKLIVGNWKQNKSREDIVSWIATFSNLISEKSLNVDIVIAPAFPYFDVFKSMKSNFPNFHLASQDVSAFPAGRHTGEVGSDQLKDFVEYSIVGHSERKEDRALVLQKGTRLFEVGIIPILCFVDLDAKIYAPGSILAWEDPDNISNEGGYRAKSISEISQGLENIRRQLPKEARVLYGGSVNKENASSLGDVNFLDGVLVGNASLDPNHFFEIVKAFSK